ncbi:MAG: hypothetical protein ABI175_16150 [Polyangiales bacterium]
MRTLVLLLAASTSMIAIVGLTTAGCSDDDAASTSDAADASNTNTCHAYPGMDEPCSPTSACPAPLTCYYEPGCAPPVGHCRVWELCGDTAMEAAFPFCSCEGGPGSPRQPYAGCSAADAGATDGG